jgi:hypothetical protein
MTAYESFHRKKSFIPDGLPWILGGIALLGYLLTLNHWVGMNSLQMTAQVGGWSWPQNYLGPVHFLVTYPLRWLAPATLPLGLNIFTAVCAALTLTQLARAIALLPHATSARARVQRLLPAHHPHRVDSPRVGHGSVRIAIELLGKRRRRHGRNGGPAALCLHRAQLVGVPH